MKSGSDFDTTQPCQASQHVKGPGHGRWSPVLPPHCPYNCAHLAGGEGGLASHSGVTELADSERMGATRKAIGVAADPGWRPKFAVNPQEAAGGGVKRGLPRTVPAPANG